MKILKLLLFPIILVCGLIGLILTTIGMFFMSIVDEYSKL